MEKGFGATAGKNEKKKSRLAREENVDEEKMWKRSTRIVQNKTRISGECKNQMRNSNNNQETNGCRYRKWLRSQRGEQPNETRKRDTNDKSEKLGRRAEIREMNKETKE